MFATQPRSAAHAVAFSTGLKDAHGEAVLVMPRHSARLDDRVFASHASFGWRVATVVLAQGGGSALRYKTSRLVATFAARDLPRVRPGDRISRSWDGAVFEVTAVYRESGNLCCELVELDGTIH